MAAAMAAEAAERHLGLLRDEREAEVAQSRCGTPTGHRLGGGHGGAVARGEHRATLRWDPLSPVGNPPVPCGNVAGIPLL